MFQTKAVEKTKIHVLFSITFFFENFTVYEITWKNVVQPDRPQMTIWGTRIACCIPKAKNTHSEYVMFITLPQQFLYERSSKLCYKDSAPLVVYMLPTLS